MRADAVETLFRIAALPSLEAFATGALAAATVGDMTEFYGAAQAAIHHTTFGDLAADAAALIVERISAAGLTSGRVTDLGCGSGILAAALLAAGYDVDGIDLSSDMIDLARTTAPAGEFRVGSVHDAAIRPSVAVAATGEVLNYAVDPRAGLEALTAVGDRVFQALAPGGVFAFDISTPGRNLGAAVRPVFHNHDTWLLGMHATETDHRLERRIVILSREPDGRYRRVDEHYDLVLYDVDAVTDALETVGFTVQVLPCFTEATSSQPPSGWAVFVATKPRD